MEFLKVVGDRRSIRWFRTWDPVPRHAIQRILEVARLTGCPGNLQPWRAVVVEQATLDPDRRNALLDANNRQRAHEQAPVWIYWFGDPHAAVPDAFIERICEILPTGALPISHGWSEETAVRAIRDGRPVPVGLPPIDLSVHGLPYEFSCMIAAQETNAACTAACLAAVDAGLGTCLHSVSAPERADDVVEALGVPEHFVPVWVQLLGYPAESPEAGGQRPRLPFGETFSLGSWGTPFPRDGEVVDALRDDGLLQREAPLPGRDEELEALARMFGYDGNA